MISWSYKVVRTGETRDALGKHPHGWIVYTPERVMVLVLRKDRKRPLEPGRLFSLLRPITGMNGKEGAKRKTDFIGPARARDRQENLNEAGR